MSLFDLNCGWRACSGAVYGFSFFLFSSSLQPSQAGEPSTPPTVLINEIHFDPSDKTRREEFIELHNTGSTEVNLEGWRFGSGVDFTFPSGTIIPANGYLAVAENPAHFQTEFGFLPLGPWSGGLQNDGETITLLTQTGELADEVDYGVGFPWPTDPHGEGASMELLHPDLDNDLGGSWRASGPVIKPPPPQTFIGAADSTWRYRKGTSAPSGAGGAWRQLDYPEDASWDTGRTPIGYGDGDDNTVLNDMLNNFTTVYLRHTFEVSEPIPSALLLTLNIDDGAVAWINGQEVARFNESDSSPAFDATADGAGEPVMQQFIVSNTSMLRPGVNVLAIHAINQSASSSDLTIDAELRTPDAGSLVGRPTPGAPNSALLASLSDAPPQIRQVDHNPPEPKGGEIVTITAKITDPDGISSVTLHYQLVNPGQYIRKSDSAYNSSWVDLPMVDDGSNGDAVAGDAIYSVQMPTEIQVHRRLVRYRISAEDEAANLLQVPYPDDESPNFAYFVYDGAPGWHGARRPGTTPVLEFPATLMNSLPTYHLLANGTDVANSQWNGSYDTVRMWGTLVYDGEVYDHIVFHNRGEGSTYNTGKNKWRFHFNRARDFKARDLWGRPYKEEWKVLNFNACASPWAAVNRGMAGLDEGISFRLYELAGVPSSKTHYVHFRVIDGAAEASANSQYEGDLWGLYQAIEQPDGNFLDERGLPDGNVYKIEGGGDKKNQGATQTPNTSDWNAFASSSRTTQTEAWWRTNMNMPSFYSFHAMNRVCGNVDLRHNYNHYAYHHPDGQWVIMPWDMDMMFISETHWPGIVDQNNSLSLPALAMEFRNRCREILDLLCSDRSEDGGQIGQLIDEFADIVNPPGQALTWADLDECMWNWNPQTRGSNNPDGQTNHKGNFNRTPFNDPRMGGTWLRTLASADHEGFVKYILDYCTDTDPDGFAPGDGDQRGYGYNYLELEAADSAIPERPTITYSGEADYPAEGLTFECSPFSDPQSANTFGAVQWRLAEIYNPSMPNYVAGEPRKYELEPVWQSSELTTFASGVAIPVSLARPGSTYRARVRMKDNTGRWSHWSEPIQFVAGAPDVSAYASSVVISEFMVQPASPTLAEAALGYSSGDFEFIELKNISAHPLDLGGVRFTKGIDFDFAEGTTLPAGGYGLVVRHAEAFQFRYGEGLPVLGSYGPDNLSNEGEQLKLSYGAGTAIHDFTYGNLVPWPPAIAGRSLVLIRPEDNPQATNALNWRASAELGGSPGFDDSQSFEAWKTDHSISSDTNDSDGDGLLPFVEYATGGHPDSSSKAFSAGMVNGALEITVKRHLRADHASHSLEMSSDLGSWSSSTANLSARTIADEVETFHYTVPIEAGVGAFFLRLNILGNGDE